MGNQRYWLQWDEYRNDRKIRNSRVSPHVASKGRALFWLIQQKPGIDLSTLTIEAWNRNQGQKGV